MANARCVKKLGKTMMKKTRGGTSLVEISPVMSVTELLDVSVYSSANRTARYTSAAGARGVKSRTVAGGRKGA